MKAEEMTLKLSEIIAKVKEQQLSSPYSKNYAVLLSRISALDEIKKALKDSLDVYKIGVYGMGGVGKSTLVKELELQVQREGSFDVVLRADVTRSPNLTQIQDQLAKGLGMKLGSNQKNERARELRQKMIEKKSILVLLDDIWDEDPKEESDIPDLLEELGILCGEQHRGCKLVLTSRDRYVLDKMGSQRNFFLGELSEEESWSLFKKVAGDVVEKQNITSIAVDVANCCCGLPLLITVAKALRKKEDVCIWEDALARLQRVDYNDQVMRKLKFSYDCLENEELKALFLLIGFLGNDVVSTDKYLFPICWGLGIYEKADTLYKARNKHDTLIKHLRAASLLLPVEEEMHDLLRKLAESIAPEIHPSYELSFTGDKKEWPKLDELEQYHSVCIRLDESNIAGVPEMLKCPKLKLLLFLGRFFIGENIPDKFFSRMQEVNVLYLYAVELGSLYPFAKLRSLSLIDSRLQDMTAIGELTCLEILILDRVWNMEELPKEIGRLACLRMLKVSNCQSLRLIPKNILSSLKCLEELYMSDYFDIHSSDNQSSDYTGLGEITSLNQLTTLNLYIEDGSDLPKDLGHIVKLRRYQIFVGMTGFSFERTKFLHPEFCGFSRTLGISMYTGTHYISLLPTVESLYLSEMNYIRSILPESDKDDFKELKYLNRKL